MKLQFKSVETPLNTVLNTLFNVFAKSHPNGIQRVYAKHAVLEMDCEQKLQTDAN